jgi:hypothetical protein
MSVGCGVPPERIDFESFITAANICDEPVTLAAGGTQRRYQTSGTMTDADSRIDIINTFLACMNGTMRDSNGRLTVTVLKNDLADYVLEFDENDILGEFQWNQTRGLTDSYNVVRGRYVDPSDASLFQYVDYPEVRLDAPDGIDRVLSLDLPYVEDGKRAQRIAKQFLQRSQYKGTFSAVFTAKALGCQVGDIVLLTFTPLGWYQKPFRVVSQQINFSGQVPLELVEENAAIYAWDNEEKALVQPTAPTVYDPLNNPLILGVAEASTSANWANITGTVGQPTGTDVAGTINSGGGVGTDQVNNASIINNSVTDVTASYTSGTINAVAGTFVTAQSATITANGSPININATLLQKVQIYGGVLDEIRILRNGSSIFTAQLPAYPSAVGDIHGGLGSFKFYDTPSPGSTTYILEFKQSTAGTNVISNRQLSLLQVKK